MTCTGFFETMFTNPSSGDILEETLIKFGTAKERERWYIAVMTTTRVVLSITNLFATKACDHRVNRGVMNIGHGTLG